MTTLFSLTSNTTREQQRGLSLIDMLITLSLSTFLIGSLFQMLINNHFSSQHHNAQTWLEENALFAMQLLIDDLQLTGFVGCSTKPSLTLTSLSTTFPSFDPLRGVDNYPQLSAFSDLQTLLQSRKNQFIEHSDIISTQHSSPHLAPLNATSTHYVTPTNPDNLNKNEILLLSNCRTAHIVNAFVTQQSSQTRFLKPSQTGSQYDTNAWLSAFKSHTYYVANTGRKNRYAENISALYRHRLTITSSGKIRNNYEEIVEGVEHVQVLYGEKNNNTLRYVPSNTAGINWNNIIAIKLAVLVSNPHVRIKSPSQQAFTLLNETLTTAAGSSVAASTMIVPYPQRLRQVVSATIHLTHHQQP